MRVEIKAYGKGKSASIAKAVGEVRLRADSEGDAEFLKSLSDAVQRADLLAVLLLGGLWNLGGDVALVVRGDAFEAADRDGAFLNPAATAGRLARTVADAP